MVIGRRRDRTAGSTRTGLGSSAPVFVMGGLELSQKPDDSYAILLDYLTRRLRTMAAARLYTVGSSMVEGWDHVALGPTLLGRRLAAALWTQRPRLIFYVYPITLPALCRARLMSLISRGGKVVMLAPQPVRWTWWSSRLAGLVWPFLVMLPSQEELEEAGKIGPAASYRLGVDTERFRPPGPGEKAALRRSWGLPPDGRLVLHVGHLVPSRNLAVMAELAKRPGIRPVVLVSRIRVSGSAELEAQLRRAGVLVLTDYRPNVEELYRAADCYLFPVREPSGAIAMPLSVLEALASDLPVVSTPFGILPQLFQAGPGLKFASSDEQLVSAVEQLLQSSGPTRHLIEPYSWDRAIDQILERIGWD